MNTYKAPANAVIPTLAQEKQLEGRFKVAGIFSLLIALAVSLIVNRIAALALMFTGLSRESARFQARSAFSGVGFTTSEAEGIVNHPVRRRIVMILMLLGNVGIATVIATVMISFSSTFGQNLRYQLLMLLILSIGLLLLWYLSTSRWVERQLNKVIARALKQFTDLDVRDYVSLLQLSDGYGVSEMLVEPGHWLTKGPLTDLRLSDEGILVLGIHRPDGRYTGIPRALDSISAGDTIIIYGNLENIGQLDRRRAGHAGDQQHAAQVQQQAEKESAMNAAEQ